MIGVALETSYTDDARTPSWKGETWAPPRPHPEQAPALRVLTGIVMGRSFRLAPGEVVLGRGSDSDVVVPDEGVSRRHARVRLRGPLYTLADLGSKNGTYLNERRVTTPSLLTPGDCVRLGPSLILRFAMQDDLDARVEWELYTRATRDPLTSLLNRRALSERLSMEWAWARRRAQPLAVCVLDVDAFKQINDAYGHAGGDAVLRDVAARLRAVTRTEDVVARTGGEEFIVLARATTYDGARALAERLRADIESCRFLLHGVHIPVTASFGIATSNDASVDTADALVARADAAMYLAKAKGRNRVESFPE